MNDNPIVNITLAVGRMLDLGGGRKENKVLVVLDPGMGDSPKFFGARYDTTMRLFTSAAEYHAGQVSMMFRTVPADEINTILERSVSVMRRADFTSALEWFRNGASRPERTVSVSISPPSLPHRYRTGTKRKR